MSDQQTPSRRDFLQSIGIGVIAPVGVHTDTPTELYQSPPPDAPKARIPVRRNPLAEPNPDEWVVHQFGWKTEGNEGRQALEKVRTSATYSFQLDGHEVTDLHKGWMEITEAITGHYVQKWQYAVPPLSTGVHTFELQIEFEEPIRTHGNPERVWEGMYQFKGQYKVNSEPTHSALSDDPARNKRDCDSIRSIEQYTIDDSGFLNHG